MMFHQSADMKVECLKITLLVVVVVTQKQVQTRLLLCGIFFTRKYIFPFFKTLWCSHCCYCSYKFRDQAIVRFLCSTDITKIYLASHNLKPCKFQYQFIASLVYMITDNKYTCFFHSELWSIFFPTGLLKLARPTLSQIVA